MGASRRLHKAAGIVSSEESTLEQTNESSFNKTFVELGATSSPDKLSIASRFSMKPQASNTAVSQETGTKEGGCSL